MWKKVLATHMEEQQLAAGPWLGDAFPGVALPCRRALNRWVMLRHGNKTVCAKVVDVGPWCVDDAEYVFGSTRPRAELFKGRGVPMTLTGHANPTGISNGAGIDLFPAVAADLGLEVGDNVELEWQFVEG